MEDFAYTRAYLASYRPQDPLAAMVRALCDDDSDFVAMRGVVPLGAFRRGRRRIYRQYLREFAAEWREKLRAKIGAGASYRSALRMQAAFQWHLAALRLCGCGHVIYLPVRGRVQHHAAALRSLVRCDVREMPTSKDSLPVQPSDLA